MNKYELRDNAKMFAMLAKASYQDDEYILPPGWTLLEKATPDNGFYRPGKDFSAAAFYHPEHGVVIAYRGTKDKGHFKADINEVVKNNNEPADISNIGNEITAIATGEDTLALQRWTKGKTHLQLACGFAEYIKAKYPQQSERLSTTGHSLGAWLAGGVNGYFAKQGTIIPSFLYECPGLYSVLSKAMTLTPQQMANLKIMAFLAPPNGVNTVDQQVGQVFQVTLQYSLKAKNYAQLTMNSHSLKFMLDQMNSSGFRLDQVYAWPRIHWEALRDNVMQVLISAVSSDRNLSEPGVESVVWKLVSHFRDHALAEVDKFYSLTNQDNGYYVDARAREANFTPVIGAGRHYESATHNFIVSSSSLSSTQSEVPPETHPAWFLWHLHPHPHVEQPAAAQEQAQNLEALPDAHVEQAANPEGAPTQVAHPSFGM